MNKNFYNEFILFIYKYAKLVCIGSLIWLLGSIILKVVQLIGFILNFRILGYLNVSFAWVLFAVFVYLLKQKDVKEKRIKNEMRRGIFNYITKKITKYSVQYIQNFELNI